MKRILTTLVVLTGLIGAGGAVWAQDLNKGLRAAQNGDFEIAFEIIKPLAEQGDARAQFNLGVMYNRGEGVTQDYTEAVKWCRKAAEQGNAGCQGILAIMYAIGRGVSKDGVSALMWLNIAAANGYKDENLERATKMLSASDLEKIQQRAKRCMASSYKDCD